MGKNRQKKGDPIYRVSERPELFLNSYLCLKFNTPKLV